MHGSCREQCYFIFPWQPSFCFSGSNFSFGSNVLFCQSWTHSFVKYKELLQNSCSRITILITCSYYQGPQREWDGEEEVTGWEGIGMRVASKKWGEKHMWQRRTGKITEDKVLSTTNEFTRKKERELMVRTARLRAGGYFKMCQDNKYSTTAQPKWEATSKITPPTHIMALHVEKNICFLQGKTHMQIICAVCHVEETPPSWTWGGSVWTVTSLWHHCACCDCVTNNRLLPEHLSWRACTLIDHCLKMWETYLSKQWFMCKLEHLSEAASLSVCNISCSSVSDIDNLLRRL